MQTTPNPIWQILAWKAAVIAAFVAAFAALVKGFWALWQHRKELRWQQAELARVLTDQWFAWEGSHNALRMVDEGDGSYTIKEYGTYAVHPEADIPRALAVEGPEGNQQTVSNTGADRLIRKSFDVLLYSFERVEHSVQIGVVRRDDVAVPAEFYVNQLARFYGPIATYIDYVGFPKATLFLRSFKGWEDAAKCHERLATLRSMLNRAFAPDTAFPVASPTGQTNAPSAGHCAVVAAIVNAELGGQMFRTTVDGEEHWFNRVAVGQARFDADLTADQFGGPEIRIELPDKLYPDSAERSFADMEHEAYVRACRLAGRAGLRMISWKLKLKWARTHGRGLLSILYANLDSKGT